MLQNNWVVNASVGFSTTTQKLQATYEYQSYANQNYTLST